MHIDNDTVRKIAHLAKLDVKESMIQPISKDLETILQWVSELDKVDTEAVDPLFSVHLDKMPIRKDAVTDGGIQSEILYNAPERELDMFVVPKVVE